MINQAIGQDLDANLYLLKGQTIKDVEVVNGTLTLTCESGLVLFLFPSITGGIQAIDVNKKSFNYDL